jgi:hypothetical protein
VSYGAEITSLLAMTDAGKIAKLQGVIADALAAMDAGEYGTARRILRTGRAEPPKVVTGVLAKGQ